MNIKTLRRTLEIASVLCPTNNKAVRSSHVAFLVRKGKIVHVGWNKHRTHPYNLNHPYHGKKLYVSNHLYPPFYAVNVGIHAELDVCLKSGSDDLNGYEMIVIRVDKRGLICNSKPCKGCQSVIRQFGIQDVWFSNVNGQMQKLDNL